MDVVLLLVPVAMILVVLVAGIFFWSVKSGQMEDLEGPAYRVLMDDDRIPDASSNAKKDNYAEKKIDL